MIDGGKTEAAGSPPPMRGKALFEEYDFEYARITPAYAGKSEQPF